MCHRWRTSLPIFAADAEESGGRLPPSGGRSASVLFLALLLSACASAPPERTSSPGLVPVGVAELDITPAEPIRLTGYGSRNEPTGDVKQRLWAKALAFGTASQ